MPQLVALDLEGTQRFVDTLTQVWERGDAVAVLDRRLPAPAAAELMATLRPNAIIDAHGERQLADGVGVEVGDALVVATSGSLGNRRAAVLTHHALAASARASSQAAGVDPARHTWLCCLPLAHIGGLSVVTRSVLTATPVVVLAGFDASVVEALGRRGKVTHVSLVPTALARLDPGVFTKILLGGAAAPEGLAPNVVTTYGMTETGSGVVYDGVALEGVEISFGQGDANGGAPGEILIRCPMQLRAYRDGSDPTVAGPDGRGGWLATGDAGHLDGHGRLVVDGRLAEVVITGAEKVWPNSVEAVLAAHRKIAQVAVWKRPDPEWGERVVAWVVAVDETDPPTLQDLGGLVAERLAPWAAPKELVLVDALPRTASGKVRRTALR